MMKKFLIVIVMALTAMAAKAAGYYVTDTTTNLQVWAEFPEPIVADGETVNYIKVYQHDLREDANYTAFNMRFVLPEGFRVNKVKEGRREVNDIHLSARADETHMISCNLVGGVDLRIIADSSMNYDFYRDDEDGNPLDELFTVGLIAEPTLATGDYTVELTQIKFVFATGDACVPVEDPVYYTIHVENPTTGIDEVEAVEGDALDPNECYDLNGRKVDPRNVHGMIVVCKGKKFVIR